MSQTRNRSPGPSPSQVYMPPCGSGRCTLGYPQSERNNLSDPQVDAETLRLSFRRTYCCRFVVNSVHCRFRCCGRECRSHQHDMYASHESLGSTLAAAARSVRPRPRLPFHQACGPDRSVASLRGGTSRRPTRSISSGSASRGRLASGSLLRFKRSTLCLSEITAVIPSQSSRSCSSDFLGAQIC